MLMAVLLDIDGTLVASNDAHASAWADALREFGYDRDVEQIRRWIGMGGDKILPLIDKQLDDEHEPGKSILKVRLKIFMERYAPDLEPAPGAAALLDRLHAAGLLRVAATSANETEFKKITETAGIAERIDLATTADDAERSKPDADIVRAALEKAQTTAAQAVYVGDTPYDVVASHKAGIPIVALRCGGWSAAELRDADAVYEDPAELLREFERSPIERLVS
jgi:HAD superfamily hydrolase (TIGR01509 family)